MSIFISYFFGVSFFGVSFFGDSFFDSTFTSFAGAEVSISSKSVTTSFALFFSYCCFLALSFSTLASGESILCYVFFGVILFSIYSFSFDDTFLDILI